MYVHCYMYIHCICALPHIPLHAHYMTYTYMAYIYNVSTSLYAHIKHMLDPRCTFTFVFIAYIHYYMYCDCTYMYVQSQCTRLFMFLHCKLCTLCKCSLYVHVRTQWRMKDSVRGAAWDGGDNPSPVPYSPKWEFFGQFKSMCSEKVFLQITRWRTETHASLP